MLTLTESQLDTRWDNLNPALREAIFSDVYADFIAKTCENEHLTEEMGYVVAAIAGYVLMGFLHPGDMAEELIARLGLNPQVAASIANAINGRVFVPLKDEIEKAYAPISKLGTPAGPKILQDIGVPVPAPAKPVTPVTAPKPAAVPAPAPISVLPPKVFPQTAPVVPATPTAGWSRSTTEAPVVKLQTTSTPPPQNSAAPKAPLTAPKPAAIPINGPVGEFERIAIQSGQKNITPPAAPVTPKPTAPMPAPVMLHEDASFKPAQQPPNFHLQLPEQQFGGPKLPPPPPSKPAVLEFGKPPAPPSPPAAPTRVVHYSEYKSPSPEAPVTGTAQTGTRQVTELTSAPVPTPPKPPAPPAPSAPPQPGKVIFKDYGSDPPKA